MIITSAKLVTRAVNFVQVLVKLNAIYASKNLIDFILMTLAYVWTVTFRIIIV